MNRQNEQIDRWMDRQDQIRLDQNRIEQIEQNSIEHNRTERQIDRQIDRKVFFDRSIEQIEYIRIDLSIDGYRIDSFDKLDRLNGFDRLDRLNRQEDRQMIMERKQRKWRQIDLQRDNKNGIEQCRQIVDRWADRSSKKNIDRHIPVGSKNDRPEKDKQICKSPLSD